MYNKYNLGFACSLELLHTDSAEETGLELGIVIIKKEHPFLLFHQKDALSWLFFV